MDKVKIAQALSDPIRYKILTMLVDSENACCSVASEKDHQAGLCNCEIMCRLTMIQSRVSYHMKGLMEAGLVYEEPKGKWKYYFLNRPVLNEFISQLKRDFKLV
jgi:ArsR family transcriptional regulator